MPATCMIYGQAYLAQTDIGQTLAENERVKVQCWHEKSTT